MKITSVPHIVEDLLWTNTAYCREGYPLQSLIEFYFYRTSQTKDFLTLSFKSRTKCATENFASQVGGGTFNMLFRVPNQTFSVQVRSCCGDIHPLFIFSACITAIISTGYYMMYYVHYTAAYATMNTDHQVFIALLEWTKILLQSLWSSSS